VFVPLGLVVGTAGRARTYRATDRGLEIQTPLARRLLPWDAFEGFADTGGAIVLTRSEPWYVDLRCGLADLEDPDAVRDALATYLDRES
jgi:hypothetical protein